MAQRVAGVFVVIGGMRQRFDEESAVPEAVADRFFKLPGIF
jgi:hypothetical protein